MINLKQNGVNRLILLIIVAVFLALCFIGVRSLIQYYQESSVQDTYIMNGTTAKNYNYGASDFLIIDQDYPRILLKFDLHQIPQGSNITSALLKIWGSSGNSASHVNAYMLTKFWYQGTGDGTVTGDGATWIVADPFGDVTNWATAGGDYNTTLIGSANYVGGSARTTIDVTTGVQWISDRQLINRGFILQTPETSQLKFYSIDGYSGERGPYLNITYTLPNPSISLLTPANNSLSAGAITFNCNGTSGNPYSGISSMRLAIYNSTTFNSSTLINQTSFSYIPQTCSQEIPNVTNCGTVDYNGTWEVDQPDLYPATNPSALFDSNITSFATNASENAAYILIEAFKPKSSNSAIWQIDTDCGTINTTLNGSYWYVDPAEYEFGDINQSNIGLELVMGNLWGMGDNGVYACMRDMIWSGWGCDEVCNLSTKAYGQRIIWNLEGNYTVNQSIVVTLPREGNYYWTCYANETLHESDEVGYSYVTDYAPPYFKTTMDSTGPVITFQSPTPDDASRQILNSATINVTMTDFSTLSSCILQMNGVNYTMTLNGYNCNYTMATVDGTTYTYKVYVNDTGGNIGNTSTRSFKENTKPTVPSSITLLPSIAYKNTTFTCSASGSSDADTDSILYYYQFNDTTGILQNYSTTATFNCTASSSCQKSDTVYCNARANDGYENGTSTTQSVSILNTVPQIGSWNISNSTWSTNTGTNIDIYENTTNGTYTFNITSVTDIDSETHWYDYFVDGVRRTVDVVNSWWNWVLGSDSPGSHNVTVIVNDSSNAQTSKYWNITIHDVLNPNIIIAHPTANTYYSNNASIPLNFTITDVHRQACWYNLNNGANTTIASCANTTFSVANGVYNLTLYSNDTSGNVNYSTVSNIYVDSILPRITITYPANTSYTTAVSTLNYTYVEVYPSSCWYSTDGGVTNTSLTCGTNKTGLTASQGSNKWMIKMQDSAGNVNQTYVTFFVDSANPTINFTSPTETTGSYLNRNNIVVNVTATDASLANITIYLYNSDKSLNRSNTTTTSPNYINYTGLSNGVYYFNATSYDSLSNKNSTETRNVTIDTVYPLISYTTGMDSNGANKSQNYIFINTSWTEVNFKNITFKANANSQTFTTSTTNYTFTGLSNGVYYYNATICDLANWCNTTTTYTITLDTTAPNATLIFPSNNTYNSSLSQNFTFNASDNLGIKNATLNIYNETGSFNQTNTDFTPGTLSRITGIVVTLREGIYKWWVSVWDWAGNTFSTQNNTLIIDTTNPRISLVYPTNTSYNSIQTAINFTVSDTNLNTCWYSTNGGTTNTTTSCTANKSGLTSNQGSNVWLVGVNDSANNKNQSTVTFFVDSIKPTINFTGPTPGNNTYQTSTSITVNFTGTEVNFQSGWISWNNVNYTATCSGTAPYYCNYTFSALTNNQYNYIAYANDSVGNVNQTEQRRVTVDTTYPLISYGTNSETDGNNVSRNNIYVNISVTETNEKNITFTLRNLTSPVNTTTYTTAQRTINWTGLPNTDYNYNVTVCDQVNYCNTTISRTIRLDTVAPNATLISPANNSYNSTTSQNFTSNITDNLGIKNATLTIYNETGFYNETSVTITPTVTQKILGIVVNLFDGVYKWWMKIFDTAGNSYTTQNNTITIDTIAASGSIAYPLNTSYNYVITALNYSISDLHLSSCWYSTDGGTTNITMTCGINITGLNSGQGSKTWMVASNDSAGNTNASYVTFFVDSIYPTINLTSPTETSGAYLNRNNIIVNVTSIDTNLANITIYLYNSDHSLNRSNVSTTSPYFINYTGLSDGVYYFNSTVRDILNNLNSTETRNVTIDITKPLIDWGTNTAEHWSNLSQSYIYANVTWTELNFKNITFTLKNDTSIINSTTFTTSTYNINWTGLVDGNYTYYVNITDLAENTNSTSIRYILIDDTLPNALLVYPTNNTYNSSTAQNFTVNLTDNLGIKNATLYIYNQTNSWLTFDGMDDYINFSQNTGLNVTGNLTLSLWVNVKSFPALGPYYSFLMSYGSPGETEPINSLYSLTFLSSNVIGSFHESGSGTDNGNYTSLTSISANSWYYLTLVRNIETNNLSFYINGILFESKTYASDPSGGQNSNLQLARSSTTSDSYFNGSIDEIRIYNRTLTLVEIVAINNSGRNPNSSLISTGLISWWDFQDKRGNVITDKFGSNNGTIIGATWSYQNATTTTYSSNVLTTTLGIVVNLWDGVYNWFYDAYDWAGNLFKSDINTLTIDTTKPLISFNPSTTANGTWITDGVILVNITATDTNLNQVRFQWQVTNETFDNSNGNIYWESKTSLTTGTYTFYAWANDLASNYNSTVTRTIYVDRENPIVSIGQPAPINYNVNTSLPLNITFSDTNLQTCWWNIDNGINTTITCGNNYTFNTSEGTHTIYAYANDSANRIGSDSVTFAVNLAPPSITIDAPFDNEWLSSTNVTIKWTASDTDGISTCELWGSWGPGWHLNESITSVTSGVQITKYKIIPEGSGYLLNIKCNDTGDNWASGNPLGNNTFNIDSTDPIITYDALTTADQNNQTEKNIYVKVDVTETNEETITFALYNTSGQVNITSSTIGVREVNWTNLNDDTYYFNVTVNDSASNIQNTSTRVVRIDTTGPTVTINTPQEINYNYNDSLTLNTTIIDNIVGVDTCWYNIENESGYTFFSNIIYDCVNATFSLPSGDVDYYINVWANDTLGNTGNYGLTFGIRTESPAIVLNNPSNNKNINRLTNIQFNITPSDREGIDTCKLYGNWSGGWHLNQTLTTVTEGINNNFNLLNISEGTYIWNAWCNDTNGWEDWALNNLTFVLDITNPGVKFTTLNATTVTPSFTFDYDVTDLHQGLCYYNIYSNATGWVFSPNQSLTCTSTSKTTAVTSDGTYDVHIWAYDLAGNTNSSVITIIASAPESPSGSSGSSTEPVVGNLSWGMFSNVQKTMTSYTFEMVSGSTRDREIYFFNDETKEIKVSLTCEDGDLCQYLTLDKENITIPVALEIPTVVNFHLQLPADIAKGNYIINIKGTDQEGQSKIITISANVGIAGVTIEAFTKLGSSKDVFGISVPYILISLFVMAITFVLFNYIFLRDIKIGLALSIVIAIFMGIFILFLL